MIRFFYSIARILAWASAFSRGLRLLAGAPGIVSSVRAVGRV